MAIKAATYANFDWILLIEFVSYVINKLNPLNFVAIGNRTDLKLYFYNLHQLWDKNTVFLWLAETATGASSDSACYKFQREVIYFFEI